MGIYSFTIQEIDADDFADIEAKLKEDNFTFAYASGQSDVAKKGTVEGTVYGFDVKFGYGWTNSNNLTIQILKKPFLTPNSIIEHKIRSWFQPNPPVPETEVAEVEQPQEVVQSESIEPVVPVEPEPQTTENHEDENHEG